MGSAAEASSLVDRIGDAADFFKVGMELYAVAGMHYVERLRAKGKKVFVDLKLYDIGETVKRATRHICQTGIVEFLTVHGSTRVMQAAVEGREDSKTKLLGVSVLTSFDQEDIEQLGFKAALADLVDLRVRNALNAGFDGIICSPREVARVREISGPSALLVTPGVRSRGADTGDQRRTATPFEAIRNGADYLVIGRQVTRAVDPADACRRILEEVGAAL